MVPHNPKRFLILRTEPNNREAIDFALDQLLRPPLIPLIRVRENHFSPQVWALIVTDWIFRLEQAINSKDYREFEDRSFRGHSGGLGQM